MPLPHAVKGYFTLELWLCALKCDALCNFSFGPSLGGARLCSKDSFILLASEETAMSLLLLMGGKLCQQMNHSQRNCRNQHSDEKKVDCVSILTYRFQSIGTLLMGSAEHDACSRMWAETTTHIHTYSMQRKTSWYFCLSSCNIPQGREGSEEAEGPTAKGGKLHMGCLWVPRMHPLHTVSPRCDCKAIPLEVNNIICSFQFPWRLLSNLGEDLAVQRGSPELGMPSLSHPSPS